MKHGIDIRWYNQGKIYGKQYTIKKVVQGVTSISGGFIYYMNGLTHGPMISPDRKINLYLWLS